MVEGRLDVPTFEEKRLRREQIWATRMDRPAIGEWELVAHSLKPFGRVFASAAVVERQVSKTNSLGY